MRIPFSAIFNVQVNGTVSSRTPVEIEGAQLSTGVSFGEGLSIRGTKLRTLIGHDLEVTESDGFIKVSGHY